MTWDVEVRCLDSLIKNSNSHFPLLTSKIPTGCFPASNCVTIPAMPLLKQARKKMRHDKKRTLQNKDKKIALKKLVKSMRKAPSASNLTAVFSKLDKAVKTHLIHKNKASRLKSRLSKTLAKK